MLEDDRVWMVSDAFWADTQPVSFFAQYRALVLLLLDPQAEHSVVTMVTLCRMETALLPVRF